MVFIRYDVDMSPFFFLVAYLSKTILRLVIVVSIGAPTYSPFL